MKEDELFAELRAAMKAERSQLSAWERYARGEGEPPPPAGDDPAQHAQMIEACRPLDAAAEDRIVARVQRAPTERGVVDLARVRAQRRSRVALVAGPLAAAAALFLVLRASGPSAPAGDALPAYSLTASGGAAPVRGDVGEHTTLTLGGSPDEIFEVVARPATAVAKPVFARAFAVRGGQATPIEADVQAAAGGSVRVRGRADALRDASALRIVLGDHAIESAPAPSDAHARVLDVPITR